jgi:hypothetical protein
MSLMPAFRRRRKASAIVGRLLAGYGVRRSDRLTVRKSSPGNFGLLQHGVIPGNDTKGFLQYSGKRAEITAVGHNASRCGSVNHC